MSGIPVVVVTSGGIAVTEVENGAPLSVADNGYGMGVRIVASGGMPVTFVGGGTPGVPVAPSLVVLSTAGADPADFRLTPAVGSLATDTMLVRHSQLSDFSDVDTTTDTLDPGDILPSYIDFSIDFPNDGTWYVNAGIQRGATTVWSDDVLTVVVGVANAVLRTDGTYLLRTDGTPILRAS